MALRKIVQINEKKCNGCGQCIPACHEGAIRIINGKAQLITDKLCDGLGDCLGECPLGAIEIIEREADPYDTEAVKIRQEELKKAGTRPLENCSGSQSRLFGGCPGSKAQTFNIKNNTGPHAQIDSELRQWPVQLHLVPVTAPYFKNADLLVAADCVPLAYGNFQQELLKGKAVAISCPKLDNTAPYVNKLAEILRNNEINSITIARMEVPCCGGLSRLVEQAAAEAQVEIPVHEKVISIRGKVLR
ncbi:MAG: ATP-binding protein [Peptococcaceae bacterium]